MKRFVYVLLVIDHSASRVTETLVEVFTDALALYKYVALAYPEFHTFLKDWDDSDNVTFRKHCDYTANIYVREPKQ